MKILFSIITLSFFLSCTCKNEPIEPDKIVELSNKEINTLTETQYVVSKFNGPEILQKLTFLKDKDFQFNSNGLIFSNGFEIGNWTKDRWIYLKAIDIRLLINFVSTSEMKIYTNYFDCKTQLIIEESIHLTGNYNKVPERNIEIDF